MLAPAKVNLTLHVGAVLQSGPFAGYHPVESLVVFADFGDALHFSSASKTELTIGGPFGDGLSVGEDNLIVKALIACNAPAHTITLDKNIPVSAGLGGGSANAAAVLREFDPSATIDAVSLGADVPVCRLSRTAMMEGIGERVTPQPGLGSIPAVLANPGVAISTAEIFKAFDHVKQADAPARTTRRGTLLQRAQSGTNDLEPFAMAKAPAIADLMDRMREQEGCLIARMSGSGASVFGLFEADETAVRAAESLGRMSIWAQACRLGDSAPGKARA